MDESATTFKASLADRDAQVAAAHRLGAGGFETCTALTHAMDQAISSAGNLMDHDAKEHVAILALGGYGRGELSPKSDVDIMVLSDSGERRELASETAKSFLHSLWDAKVDVGHSVRTVEEAIELRGQSLDSWTSMLESRFICGTAALADRFFDAMRNNVAPDRWLVEGILTDMENRHQRYGNSVKLLEPNIKKSAGSLRDFHALVWLYRGTDPKYFQTIHPSTPASKALLDQLQSEGIVDPEEHRRLLEAMGFLLRTRHEMHYLRESLHDTLEYGLQLKVADQLGLKAEGATSAVEVFMRQYYVHARMIDRLSRRLCRHFRETIEPARHEESTEPAGSSFLLAAEVLSVRPGIEKFTQASQILEAFLLAAENDVELDFRLHGLIERNLDLLTPEACESPELASMFRRILVTRRVGYTLRMMNELGVLGRYIPEFGRLVAFFQHNVYHYFTADEHTLIAVANAESLRVQDGVLHEVFRNLRRKDLLYVAILLHDIAKPRGVADHEVTGVGMAGEILKRLGMEDMIPDVAFLVRNHLIMEQIAFRRNVHDPATIREFAARFERPEHLDILYLLTYADLSAVNINVWTEWKSSMLRDLYLHTLEVLRRNLTGADVEQFQRVKREAAIAEVIQRLSATIPREEVENHLLRIESAAYVSMFSDQEIALHIRGARSSDPVSTMFRQAEGYTEITVIGRDAPFVLSRCCAVLAANDANIFDAGIFTREDGLIIDRFRVSDATSRRHLEHQVCTKIRDDLRHVVAGSLDVEHLFQTHKRRWKRKERPINPNVTTGVEFEDADRHTIIDVYAPDAVGFLYRVTETMSGLGLNIHFAKIATRIDGVVDAFYVQGEDGRPIVDEGRRDVIRREITKSIQALSEEQLIGSS